MSTLRRFCLQSAKRCQSVSRNNHVQIRNAHTLRDKMRLIVPADQERVKQLLAKHKDKELSKVNKKIHK